MSDRADAIRDILEIPEDWKILAGGNGHYAIAVALLVVARELQMLGNGSVHTRGALEGMSMHIGEKLDGLSQTMIETIEAFKD